MKIWVYAICYNEAKIAPWFARHYSSFADKIIVYDENSNDGTRDILKQYPKVEIRDWKDKGLDDEKFRQAINTLYTEAINKADWVMWVDMDELVYHPNLQGVLDGIHGDVVPTTGYELISRTGWPKDDGHSQLYDLVQTGVPKSNYSKHCIWRPNISIRHAHGRHTYKDWPKHDGVTAPDVGIKTLHCHSVGGIAEVMVRNKRNYDRSTDKKLGWNMAPDIQHNADQGGTVAWLERIIATNALQNVIGEQPLKVQFGCGNNHLAGWKNLDRECDISKPLPFGEASCGFLFAEHVMEHVTPKQAWGFLEECQRILVAGGVVRIAVPDIVKLWREMIPEYGEAVKKGGHGDGSKRSAVKAAIFEHGHQGAWTKELLIAVMEAVGFRNVKACAYGESEHAALKGAEGHWRVVGKAVAENETTIVEGTK
jgi:predicted SAM-dependent methyltransferase